MYRWTFPVSMLSIVVGGVEGACEYAFVPPVDWAGGLFTMKHDGRRCTIRAVVNKRRIAMSSDTVFMGGLEEEKQVNPLVRIILASSFKWATAGVITYLGAETDSCRTEARGDGSGSVATQRTLDAQRNRMANIVLCSASEERKGEEMAKFLDNCEQETGTGAVMALGLLDGLWSLPAPFRPDVGDAAVVEVYQALRRYGVLSKFGALKAPATKISRVVEEKESDLSSRRGQSSVASFVTWTDRLWSSIFVLSAIVLGLSGLGVDLQVSKESWFVLNVMLLDSVFLDRALFREVQHWIMPAIKERAAYHEAGHFLLSYLLGCPISVYTVGGWPSIRHGRKLGSNPFIESIDSELKAVLQGSGASLLDAIEGPRRRVLKELSVDEMADILWRVALDDWKSPGGLFGLHLKERDMTERFAETRTHADGTGEAQRNTLAHRFALLVMAGVAAENVVTGFDIGGQGDRDSLRMTLLRLCPVVSSADLNNTETWAACEGVRILTAERNALNVLAESMSEARQIGRLIVDLERTLASPSFEVSS